MRPQLERVAADILCLQEVHSQGAAGSRTLQALDQLLAGTPYAAFTRQTTLTVAGQLYDQRNIVTLSRFPITGTQIIRDSAGPRPSYQMATANPPDTAANAVEWERPMQVPGIGSRSGHRGVCPDVIHWDEVLQPMGLHQRAETDGGRVRR